MIMPTKRLGEDRSLLAIGAGILRLLDEPKTVSRLWEELKHKRIERLEYTIVTYDWFVLAIDFLYIINAVELNQGRLRRIAQ